MELLHPASASEQQKRGVARAAARGGDPVGVRHDRTRRRQQRCHQHRHADRAGRRRVRHRRTQVVDQRRHGIPTAPSLSLHPASRPPGSGTPPADDGARPSQHPGAPPGRSATTPCSATTTSMATPRSPSPESACRPPRTSLARRAAASRPPRLGLALAGSTTACGALGAAERALALLVQRAKERVAFGRPLADQGVVRRADHAKSPGSSRAGPRSFPPHRPRLHRPSPATEATRDLVRHSQRFAVPHPGHPSHRPGHPGTRRRRRHRRHPAGRHVRLAPGNAPVPRQPGPRQHLRSVRESRAWPQPRSCLPGRSATASFAVRVMGIEHLGLTPIPRTCNPEAAVEVEVVARRLAQYIHNRRHRCKEDGRGRRSPADRHQAC